MKEFYLVPTIVYDRMTGKSDIQNPIVQKGAANIVLEQISDITPSFVTTIPPPTLNIVKNIKPVFKKKKKDQSVKMKIMPNVFFKSVANVRNDQVKKNSLSNLLSTYFPHNYLHRAEGVARIFENSNGIDWDERGDLISPIKNYNVLDVINNIIHEKTLLPTEHLKNYKYMLNMISYPVEFIINKHLRRYMNGSVLSDNRFVKSRLSGRGRVNVLDNDIVQWIGY